VLAGHEKPCGSGTLVGVGIDGKLIQTVIPMFLDQDRGSVNHKRFITVSKVLSHFDRLLMSGNS